MILVNITDSATYATPIEIVSNYTCDNCRGLTSMRCRKNTRRKVEGCSFYNIPVLGKYDIYRKIYINAL